MFALVEKRCINYMLSVTTLTLEVIILHSGMGVVVEMFMIVQSKVRKMVDKDKLREIVLEANEKVRTDPKIRKRIEDLSRELSTITPEDLHKRIRESIDSDSIGKETK